MMLGDLIPIWLVAVEVMLAIKVAGTLYLTSERERGSQCRQYRLHLQRLSRSAIRSRRSMQHVWHTGCVPGRATSKNATCEFGGSETDAPAAVRACHRWFVEALRRPQSNVPEKSFRAVSSWAWISIPTVNSHACEFHLWAFLRLADTCSPSSRRGRWPRSCGQGWNGSGAWGGRSIGERWCKARPPTRETRA